MIGRLGAIVKQQAGATEPLFRDGCSGEDVARLESTLDVRLPDDYKALLMRADGQRDWASLSFPPDRLAFLGVDEVLDLWATSNEDADDQFFEEYDFDDKVRVVLHHPGRIPIAYYELGQVFLWLDMVPGPNGSVGQLVLNTTESDLVVLEESVGALLERYTRFFESGSIAVERTPVDDGEEYYEIKASGRHIDYEVYQELKRGAR